MAVRRNRKKEGDMEMHDDHLHHEVESVRYEDEAARLNYLREIYSPKKEAPEAFRSPGTFLAEFVFNGLNFSQIVDFLKSNPSKSYCACCMDERVVMKKGGKFITSHRGCGAAGLVYGALKSSPESFERVAKVLEETGTATRRQLQEVLDGDNKDQVGVLWARALATAVGAEYAHLDIDHAHHYTTMAVIDAGGCFLGDTPGELGERSFIVSNSEILGNQDKRSAYELMIQYGFLALNIARGDHSTLYGKDDEFPFTIVVTRDEKFDQALFDQVLEKFLMDKKASGTDYAKLNYLLEFVDESILAGR